MIREYKLKDDQGRWLAQVVITDDGFFAAVSEYGNFAYAWRSFGDDFRKFLLTIDGSYFADKMQTGMAYLVSTRKVAMACLRFSVKVFPVLQEAIKKELDTLEPLAVNDWPVNCVSCSMRNAHLRMCDEPGEAECAGCPHWEEK